MTTISRADPLAFAVVTTTHAGEDATLRWLLAEHTGHTNGHGREHSGARATGT